MHSYVRELQDLYKKGKVTRREFVYYSALLGVSVGSATAFLAACGGSPTPTASVSLPATATKPVEAQPTTASGGATATVAAPAASPTSASAAAGVKRGGTLNWSERVQKIDNPWNAAWSGAYSAIRQVSETATYCDEKGITKARLLEKWEPSEDLKTWTLYLKKGVKWNNGKDFTADDLVFTMQSGIDPKLNAGMSGYLSGYLKPEGIVAKDPYTIVLNCERAEIAVAEHLGHQTAFVLPRGFGGDWIKEPIGTGPFTVAEYVTGERITYKPRTDYYDNGVDGKALPYLDGLVMTDYGAEAAASLSALSSGEVDFISDLQVSVVPSVKAYPNVNLVGIRSGNCSIMGFKIDKEPFTNKDVRTAMKLVQDRKQALDTAFLGMGDQANDNHVPPCAPEWYQETPAAADIAKAKALLAGAGHPDGIDVTINLKSSPQWEAAMAQVYKEQAVQAGIRVNIQVNPDATFWDQWLNYDFAAVEWYHRPLGIMTLNLAYRSTAGWNSTDFKDPAFDKMLDDASGTLDVEKRRTQMHQIQDYLRENGGVLNPFFRNIFVASTKRTNGVLSAPTNVSDFHTAWLSS